MLKRGSVVQVLSITGRKARGAHAKTAVALADAFEQQGIMVCPVGFFSHQFGAWAQIVPVEDLEVLPEAPEAETPKPLPRSYRPEYRIWIAMRRRCSDPRNQGYYLYANRVHVCPEWEADFDKFYEDMGPRPSPKHSLDRIDNNGDYTPGNVRWATPKEQSRNTSRTRFLTVFGETKPLVQWAEGLGITPQSLKYRLDKGGWDLEAAVSRSRDPHHPLKESLLSKRKRGESSHLSKLTEADVREIHTAFLAGESQVSIARRFAVSPGTIAFIVQRKTWKHINPDSMP